MQLSDLSAAPYFPAACRFSQHVAKIFWQAIREFFREWKKSGMEEATRQVKKWWPVAVHLVSVSALLGPDHLVTLPSWPLGDMEADFFNLRDEQCDLPCFRSHRSTSSENQSGARFLRSRFLRSLSWCLRRSSLTFHSSISGLFGPAH